VLAEVCGCGKQLPKLENNAEEGVVSVKCGNLTIGNGNEKAEQQAESNLCGRC